MNDLIRCASIKAWLLLLFSCALFTWPLYASADCTPVNGWQNKVINVIVPTGLNAGSEVPVGTILYTRTGQWGSGRAVDYCTKGGTMKAQYRNGWIPNADGIAPTNLGGIGVRIIYRPGFSFQHPYRALGDSYVDRGWLSTDFDFEVNSTEFRFEIIKTGPVQAGFLAGGSYAGLLAQDKAVQGGYWATLINVNSDAYFRTPACTVNTGNIVVSMGNVNRSSFSGIGSTSGDKVFNIVLTCESIANISVAFNANADNSAAPGVIAINSSSGVATAKGVGIRLLLRGKPIPLGTPVAIENPASTPSAYSFTAQYYQTSNTVTAGQADSTATFTLTYN